MMSSYNNNATPSNKSMNHSLYTENSSKKQVERNSGVMNNSNLKYLSNNKVINNNQSRAISLEKCDDRIKNKKDTYLSKVS